MISLDPLKPVIGSKKIYIVGLGKSGLPVFEACQKSGIDTILWDDQEQARLAAPKNAVILAPDKVDYKSLYALCLSPGVPFTHPAPHVAVTLAQKNNVEVLGDMELFHRARPDVRSIGITGTNGKSTTTALIGHVLKNTGIPVAIGGNIGEAVLTLPSLPQGAAYVLEMSSYQLDLCTTFAPDISIFINISPDHLDRHGTMDGYVAAKKKIFRGKGSAFIGIDDEWSQNVFSDLQKSTHRKATAVSCVQTLQNGVCVSADGILSENGNIVFDLKPLPALKGAHNWQNAALAYGALKEAGLNTQQIQDGFKTFPGLAHRQMRVACINGVDYINDSKATNDQAAAMALKTYHPIYWIAGGKPKDGGYADCAKHIGNIRHAYLIGAAQEVLAAFLSSHKIPFTLCGTLDRAVTAAHQTAQAEKLANAVVLLSPACASFDQFKNFEQRGDIFTDLVKTLVPQAKTGVAG